MDEKILTEQGRDLIFRHARTANAWQNKPVSDDILHRLYDLMKMGPTSANCCPLRIVFVKTADGKDQLKATLAPGNVEKTMTAPVTAILARDLEFYERLPFLFPPADARSWFAGKPEAIAETSLVNATLQSAYFILAARSLGLDCGPMTGFDKGKADSAFFSDGKCKSIMLCNLGYADHAKTHPRLPRLAFDDVVRFA